VALARLGLICLDCADPAGLAAFWAGLLGGEVEPILGDDVVMVKSRGTPVAAVRVTGYQPPTWPDGAIPKQVHLDLAVGDLDAAEAEAIGLGARRADEQPRPGRWRVMLDPAGHPFCLCDWSQPLPANRKDPEEAEDTAQPPVACVRWARPALVCIICDHGQRSLHSGGPFSCPIHGKCLATGYAKTPRSGHRLCKDARHNAVGSGAVVRG
jgi:hypothetical protein